MMRTELGKYLIALDSVATDPVTHCVVSVLSLSPIGAALSPEDVVSLCQDVRYVLETTAPWEGRLVSCLPSEDVDGVVGVTFVLFGAWVPSDFDRLVSRLRQS